MKNNSPASGVPPHKEPELPSSLKTWFWDCDFRSLSWEKHQNFIVRRILDRGDWNTIRWLRGAVGDETIRDWMLSKKGGGLDPRKLRFWELILDLPEREVDEWVRKARKSNWHERTGRPTADDIVHPKD